jgi:hypothetical protein
VPTPLGAFEPRFDADAYGAQKRMRTAMSAFIELAEGAGAELVTPVSAAANPSRRVDAAAYDTLCEPIVAAGAGVMRSCSICTARSWPRTAPTAKATCSDACVPRRPARRSVSRSTARQDHAEDGRERRPDGGLPDLPAHRHVRTGQRASRLLLARRASIGPTS